jgi:hypothetical protein
MDPAKITWEYDHAATSLGLCFCTSATIQAILSGGRGVNPSVSSSGLSMNHGMTTDDANVTIEKTIKALLPTLPIWPRESGCSFASAVALKRKYTSPNHVVE